MEKIVLAFSGGLDTTFCIPYLQENGYKALTITVNTGGISDSELKEIAEKSKDLATIEHVCIDAQKELYDDFVVKIIQANYMRGGKRAVTGTELPAMMKGIAESTISQVGVSRPDHIEEINFSEQDCCLFVNEMQPRLDELVSQLKTFEARTVILEGAHVYIDETLGDHHREQMRSTGFLQKYLTDKGFLVESSLFLDDYHPQVQSLDVEAYVQEALRQGWKIDHVFSEADMIPVAEVLVNTLQRAKKAVERDGGVVLRRGKTHLKGIDGGYSCSLLDAAFTVLKYGGLEGNAVVNVLPAGQGYESQQKNVRRILTGLTSHKKLPFFPFFVELTKPNAQEYDDTPERDLG